jgi:uncharacterized membrane protein
VDRAKEDVVAEMFRSGSLVLATVATGLMAGLYFAFSCAVMPGLGQTDARTFVAAMQRINVAILNGWFAAAFGGALLLTGVAAALHFGADVRAALPWILAALVLYAATLVLTIGINVPLNDQLVAAGDPDGIADLAAVRAAFEGRWVRWNLVRTLLGVAAFGSLAWALVVHGRSVAGGS